MENWREFLKEAEDEDDPRGEWVPKHASRVMAGGDEYKVVPVDWEPPAAEGVANILELEGDELAKKLIQLSDTDATTIDRWRQKGQVELAASSVVDDAVMKIWDTLSPEMQEEIQTKVPDMEQTVIDYINIEPIGL